MIVGQGNYRYELVENWLKLPPYWVLGEPAGIACDSHDRVFVFNRGIHPIIILDRDGNFISSWGEGRFESPHGIFIGPDDAVYITDYQSHVVEKYSPSGELLLTLGTRGFAPPVFLRRPFNQPTNVALGQAGEIYVSDGYANFVVHKFSPAGQLLTTWGTCGSQPGQFAWPHSVGLDRHGTIYVCDRENDRIQRFTPDGAFIDQWTDFMNPHDLYIDQPRDLVYTVEGNLKSLAKPGQESRVTVRDLTGRVLSEWHGRLSDGTGVLEMPHDIWVDSRGDLYLAELRERNAVLKFARVR